MLQRYVGGMMMVMMMMKMMMKMTVAGVSMLLTHVR